MNILIPAGIFGFTSVLFGAIGTHALKSILDEKSLVVFQTAVQYQFFHAIALLICGFYQRLNINVEPLLLQTAYLFIAGIFLFSGSLYLYVMTKFKVFAMITPLGGLSFLAGWGFLIRLAFSGK